MPTKPLIIGISGASASGKSLLANTIVSELGSKQVAIISEDAYYRDRRDLSIAERAKINYDHPDAFEHELLREHLGQLQRGQTIELPIYDYSEHLRSDKTRRIGQYAIIVLEGILLLADESLRQLMDIKIFMDTPLDICLIRRLQRDVIRRGRTFESVLTQYETTVRPMYQQFIEPSKRYADIIIPRGGENRIAIEVIKAKMRDLLNQVNGKKVLDNI
ncbi:MAG: uridine kinase [Legionellales bacterium]|nr:uridine kinase [Legionellales bacterium]|tara:strand:- start:281 stop:934 length:654 start_codon:yes stop_codon:yes gene_type:complete